MFIATTAINSGSDDNVVGIAVATQALAKLQEKVPGALPQMVYVFASSNYAHQEVLKGVRSVVGADAVIAGASTAGEITQLGPGSRPSVAVMFIFSDSVRFVVTAEDDVTSNAQSAGEALGVSLLQHSSQDQLRLIMMFADGLKGNPSAIHRGILSAIGKTFPIVGGSAADNGKFLETKQFFQEEVLTDAVVGVGMSGPLVYSVGVDHGWSPVGAPRTITGAHGNVVHSIDNRPAITLYADYLGELEVKNLKTHTLGEIALSYPLGLQNKDDGEILLRAPFQAKDDGSVICGGELANGDVVQLMLGSKESVVDAAKRAANAAMNALGRKPAAAFIFNSYVRSTLFENMEAAKAETRAIQDIIGADVPTIGFYTYAEHAPRSGASFLIKHFEPEVHNDTVVIVLLAEA